MLAGNKVNFAAWKQLVTAQLMQLDLYEGVTVNPPARVETKKDGAAQQIIRTMMTPSEAAKMGVCDSASSLWKKIIESYEGSREEIIRSAGRQFMQFTRKKNEDMASMIGRFETLISKLKAVGHEVGEGEKIFQLQQASPDNVKQFIRFWSITNRAGTLDQLIRDIKGDQEFLSCENSEENENMALAVIDKQKYEGQRPYSYQGSRPSSYQGSKGNSYQGSRANSYQGYKPNSYQGSRPNSHTGSGQIKTCYKCKKRGHIARECRSNLHTSYRTNTNNNPVDKFNEVAMMALDGNSIVDTPNNSKEVMWLADSAATQHMTGDYKILTNFKDFDKPREIITAGQRTSALGYGDFHYSNKWSKGVLKDVLWVMGLEFNLLSLDKAMRCGYDTLIDSKGQRIIISQGNSIKMVGQKLPNFLMAIMLMPTHEKQVACLGVSMETWHKRLAHSSSTGTILSKNMVDGMDVSGSKEIICTDCKFGKICRTNHPTRKTDLSDPNSLILHMDTFGPVKKSSICGSKYMLIMIEEYSGFRQVRFAEDKSQIKNLVKILITFMEVNTKKKVKMIITDQGSEFKNADLDSWCLKHQILREYSATYTPEQNGRAERGIRSIIESARTLLIESKMSVELWCEACKFACYALNRTPSPRIPSMTRYEVLLNKKPNISNLRMFGEYAITLNKGSERNDKFGSKGKLVRIVGYASRHNTYTVWDEINEKLEVTCDITFLPPNYTPPSEYKVNQEEIYIPLMSDRDDDFMGVNLPSNVMTEQSTSGVHTRINNTESNIQSCKQQMMKRVRANDNLVSLDKTDSNIAMPDNQDVEVVNQNVTKSGLDVSDNFNVEPERFSTPGLANPVESVDELVQSPDPVGYPFIQDFVSPIEGRKKDEKIDITFDKDIDSQNVTTRRGEKLFIPWDRSSFHSPHNLKKNDDAALFVLDTEPRNYKQISARCDKNEWLKAIQEELISINKNKTWEPVDARGDERLTKTKWVFKNKVMPDRSIIRKARLVATGYSQVYGIDYNETYSPVAMLTTIKLLLAFAFRMNYSLRQFDIKTAFLYGDLQEDIYLETPEGVNLEKGKILKLKKSLYGLKQSPRNWNIKFNNCLQQFGLERSEADQCLYYNEDRSLILAIYVDDGLVVAKENSLIKRLLESLSLVLELTESECSTFLGIEIEIRNDIMILHQSTYVQKLIQRCNMDDCLPVSTPEKTGQFNCIESPKLDETFPYRELVGCLLYLSTATRPDISHAVNIASRTNEPTVAHKEHIKHILRYLKRSYNWGIRFNKTHDGQLYAYSDSDYANDLLSRHSTTGFCILYGNGPIVHRSSKQRVVALSSTEAEVIAITELAKDIICCRNVLGSITKQKTLLGTIIFVDNISAIKIFKNGGSKQRTKHVDIRAKWIQEKLETNQISIQHVPTEYQAADFLTKPLQRKKFEWNRKFLMAISTIILTCMVGSRESYRFNRVEPVYYKTTAKPYINGLMSMDLMVYIANPCEDYFQNLTDDKELTEQIYKTCQDWFREDAINQFKFCRAKYPMEIMVLDDKFNHHREKRFVGAIVTVAVIGPTVAYVVHETRLMKDNIQEIEQRLNSESEILKELAASLNETRNKIGEISERIINMEYRIGKLNETIHSTSRMYALLANVFHYFEELKENLNNIDKQARKGKVSPFLMNLVKKELWVEPGETWSKLESCSYSLDKKGMKFVIKFQVPMIDTTTKIMEAHSLKFWNFTSNNFACRFKYSGPRYLLANQSTNCLMGIDTDWLDEGLLQGHPCMEQKTSIENIFHKEECDVFKESTNDIQIKITNGFNRIYCLGHNITINSIVESCPHFIFDLPLTQSFTLNHHHHDASNIKQEYPVNINEVQLNNLIKRNLKIDQLRIKGPNMEYLDKSLNRVNSMLNLIHKNITINHSKMEDILDYITEPWNAIYNFGIKLIDFLKGGMYLIIFVIGILIFSIITKLINYTYWISKFKRREPEETQRYVTINGD